MNRIEALEDFKSKISELKEQYIKEFENNFLENEEKVAHLLIDAIKTLNEKINKKDYKLSILQYELLRTNILDETYKIWLHGYNYLWYLDEESVYEEIDLKFLFEPFIRLKEELIKRKKIYIGKINNYDIEKIIFEVVYKCYMKLSSTIREYFWDFDEEEWIKDINLSEFYKVIWSEYQGNSEIIFAMDNKKKTVEDIKEAKMQDSKKLPFVYSVWKDSSFENIDLSKENLLFINFKGSTLKKVNFSESDIVTAQFKYTTHFNNDFSCGRVVGTSFEGSNLERCNFSESDVRSTYFHNCSIKDIDFKKSDLTLANFTKSDLYNVSFNKTILKNVDFRGCSFENVDFSEAILEGAIFNTDSVPFIHLTPEQLQDIYIDSEVL